MLLSLRTGCTRNNLRHAFRWHCSHSLGGRSTTLRRFSAVVEAYNDLVAKGVIETDARQIQIAERLDSLAHSLESYKPRPCSEYDPFISRLDYQSRQLLDFGRGGLDEAQREYRASADIDEDRISVSDLEDAPPFRGGDLRLCKPGGDTDLQTSRKAPPDPKPNDKETYTNGVEEAPELDAFEQLDIPMGLYIYGTVGSGKSMLMDLFSRHVVASGILRHVSDEGCSHPGIVRVHFQPFMEEVLNTIHEWQNSATFDETRKAHQHNLLRAIAKSIAERARVVCFDEVQMPDPASAVFIHSLFGYLFRYGAVVVATSNRPPTDLCMQGFRSATAVKFIEMIGGRCEPLQLTSSHDYRQMAKGGYMDTAYLEPQSDPIVVRRFNEIWTSFTAESIATNGKCATTAEYTCFGRRVVFDNHCHGAIRVKFSQLCGNNPGAGCQVSPLGPQDYLIIARSFHTIFLENVPSFSLGTRNEARRFIWLVDALYEHGCNLFILSAAPAHSLFVDDATTDDHATADIMLQESLGSLLENRLLVEQNESDATQFLDVTKSHIFTGQDDIFSFARCQSRLAEMQSHAYHQRKHQKDKNRIYNGKPITMPCPPPNFTPDPVDEGDDNIAEEHWAGTHMAPPLELQVEDIRRKVVDLALRQQSVRPAESLGRQLQTGWKKIVDFVKK